MQFSNLNLSPFLLNALTEMGFTKPTPIQEKSFSVIMSSKDIVGIAQTGTGKTYAYLLPILRQLTFSKQKHPRVLIVVPTRELVVQVVKDIEDLTPYINVRFTGIYGGTNINKQKQLVYNGLDILVATPGRLLDLTLDGILKLKHIQKFVIDEVDEMLNLGFRPQLITLLDLLTKEVNDLLDVFFKSPIKIGVASSGNPLKTIQQQAFPAPNFYTKTNLLTHLLQDKKLFKKVLVFVKNKNQANILFEELEVLIPEQVGVIHSNKTQNFRLRAVKKFERGSFSVLIATDIIARGLDFTNVSQVINFDIPKEPENYLHRIGRTGRAKQQGVAISFFTEEEATYLSEIELLMNTKIKVYNLPKNIKISTQKIEEEKPRREPESIGKKRVETTPSGAAFHEKKEKNRKKNLGGSYRKEIAKKYKKPKTRGQKRR